MRRRALALLVAALPLAANAELVDLKWADGGFAHKSTVAPKKFLEVCGKLKKDQKISWRFNGTAPSDFNIHYHVGKDVVYPDQRKQVSDATGTLVVPLDQDFCWMWSNKQSQPVDIDVQLTLAPGATK